MGSAAGVGGWPVVADDDGGGWLCRIDPRLRLLAAMGCAMVAVGLRELGALLAALALTVVLAWLARLPARVTAGRLLALEAFLVPLLLLLPFTMAGAPLLTIGSLEISSTGVTESLRIMLTAAVVGLAAAALIGTLEPTRLAAASQALGLPATVATLLLLAIRYIAVLHVEYARLSMAMRARGFASAPALHRFRCFGYLFGMLLVRSFDRAERVLAAMKCRGYPARTPPALRRPLRRADWIFAGAMLIALSTVGGCAWL